MTRILLRYLNAPIFVFLIALGIALQTSLFASYPFMYLQPDVVLVAVVWCALRRNFTEGGILTLLFSNIAELHSAVPQGLYLISYMSIFLMVRLTSRYFVIPNLVSLVIATLIASVIWKFELLGILFLMGIGDNQWRHTLVLLFPGAVVTGAISIWVFRWLEKFDWMTYKHARTTVLEEDLLLDPHELT